MKIPSAVLEMETVAVKRAQHARSYVLQQEFISGRFARIRNAVAKSRRTGSRETNDEIAPPRMTCGLIFSALRIRRKANAISPSQLEASRGDNSRRRETALSVISRSWRSLCACCTVGFRVGESSATL